MQVALVASQLLRVPSPRVARSVLAPGDLVIIGDIPLASDVLRGAVTRSPVRRVPHQRQHCAGAQHARFHV